MNKLYAQKDAMVPVRFSIACDGVANGLFIRALPVYSRPEHLSDVVKRCPYHSQSPESGELLNSVTNSDITSQNLINVAQSLTRGTNFTIIICAVMFAVSRTIITTKILIDKHCKHSLVRVLL